MTLPTVLDIVRKEAGRYVYTLMRGDQPFRAGSKVWEVVVDPGEVAALCDRFGEAVEAANDDPDQPGIHVSPFAALGRRLYDRLFPLPDTESLRRQLHEIRTPLLISTDDPDVHWELLSEGGESGFLCLRCEVGRTLRTSEAPSWAPPRSGDTWRCLLIANPEENLPAAAHEAATLRRWLEDAGVACDYVSGAAATAGALRTHLLKEYDILHYAGHAEQHALRLYDAEFTARHIRDTVKGSPIVFLNGCVSARAVGGLADAFIAAGARVVVGSSFRAPDDGAREFAERFYQRMLGGHAAGAAMRDARLHVIGNADCGPAWACFVLYGDPALRLELQVDAVQGTLTRLGLGRRDFDAGAGRVMDRAVAYASRMGALETAHLLAALIGGTNPFVRERLRRSGVNPAALERVFADAFTGPGGGRTVMPARATALDCTANVRALLTSAKAHAGAAGALISELDMVRAFVRSPGGRTADLLDGLGLRLAELDPDVGGTSRESSA
jgi:hypothetical protein